jgi:invasion protein IalB
MKCGSKPIGWVDNAQQPNASSNSTLPTPLEGLSPSRTTRRVRKSSSSCCARRKTARRDGTILMPFGLNLDAGAILKLDDKDLGRGVHFSTCVPQGCLLPVSFPIIATDAMKKATMLNTASLNLSSGEAVTFNISLNGFAAALARVSDLGR